MAAMVDDHALQRIDCLKSLSTAIPEAIEMELNVEVDRLLGTGGLQEEECNSELMSTSRMVGSEAIMEVEADK